LYPIIDGLSSRPSRGLSQRADLTSHYGWGADRRRK
jgi:hypothetical protein